jgi:hypothetical protein
MAMSGDTSPLMTMKMEKIWMLLPIIHIMKHMNPTCLKGLVAVCHRACVWGVGEEVGEGGGHVRTGVAIMGCVLCVGGGGVGGLVAVCHRACVC